MRFAKQKFLIVIGFFVLPLFVLFAVLQTPAVSDLVLNIALRFVRFQTGLKVDADSWRLNPLSFSASLDNISVEASIFKIRAPEISVQLSPLALLTGEIYLRSIRLDKARLEGDLPDKWFDFKSDEKKEKIDWSKLDVPTLIGEKLSQLTELLKAKRIGFDQLSMTGFRLGFKEVLLERGTLHAENLEGGQARLDWSMHNLSMPGRLGELKNFSGSLALIKESRKQYYLAVRALMIDWPGTNASHIEAVGRLPGELEMQSVFDLDKINDLKFENFVKNSFLINEILLNSKLSNVIFVMLN